MSETATQGDVLRSITPTIQVPGLSDPVHFYSLVRNLQPMAGIVTGVTHNVPHPMVQVRALGGSIQEDVSLLAYIFDPLTDEQRLALRDAGVEFWCEWSPRSHEANVIWNEFRNEMAATSALKSAAGSGSSELSPVPEPEAQENDVAEPVSPEEEASTMTFAGPTEIGEAADMSNKMKQPETTG